MNQKQIKEYVRRIIKTEMLSMLEPFGYNEKELEHRGLIEDFKGECFILEKQLLPHVNEISVHTMVQTIRNSGADFINNYLKDEIVMNEMSEFFKNIDEAVSMYMIPEDISGEALNSKCLANMLDNKTITIDIYPGIR